MRKRTDPCASHARCTLYQRPHLAKAEPDEAAGMVLVLGRVEGRGGDGGHLLVDDHPLDEAVIPRLVILTVVQRNT